MRRRVYVLTAIALVFTTFAFAATVTAAKKGSEGCTPGYWRNHDGAGSSTTFESVFGDTAVTSATTTMKQAAAIGGGGLSALVRHAAAAYLNTLSGIDYGLSTQEVIDLFAAAIASGDYEGTKNLFEARNERTCPL